MVQLRTKWVSRVLLVLVAAAPAAFIVAQQNPPKVSDQRQWKDYSYPDDGFVISLPYRVEPHDDETLSKATFSAWTVSATNAYTLHLENLAVTLHVITFPDGCSNFFSQYRSLVGASAETDHTASSKFTETTAAGHPAVENEHETKSGMRYYDRHQCADKKLYVFTANWPVDQARPSELGRVVRSFRLIPK